MSLKVAHKNMLITFYNIYILSAFLQMGLTVQFLIEFKSTLVWSTYFI